jgi:uncharacterized SAM-binding protein YcdF (DUF218 family)
MAKTFLARGLNGRAAGTTVLEHGQRLWNYMAANRTRDAADAIVVCCSYDLRVCDYACELLRQNLAPRLVLSGKTGNWTRHLWDAPEAKIFADRARANGIAPERILLELQATNFGENIAFARGVIPKALRVIFVTKPASVLRVSLTVPVQWPGLAAFVDAPPLQFPDEVSNIIGVFGVIHEMVGDIHRVIHYPSRGFQIPHELPPPILNSWHALVEAGFGQHLLPDTAPPVRLQGP